MTQGTRAIAYANTVCGRVPTSELGPTQMHEHLLMDFSRNGQPGSPPGQVIDNGISEPLLPGNDAAGELWDQPISLANRAHAERYPHLYHANSRLDSVEDAISEVAAFARAGGGCLVEVTSGGLHRDPNGLRRISRETGVHIVMGCGYYVREYHPERLRAQSWEEISDEIVGDLTIGVDGVVSGIIGEIGLSWPVHPDEAKVLRAAVDAQLRTGAALSIHPGRNPAAPVEAVKAVEKAGGNVTRTVMGHLDRTIFNMEGLLELAATGCTLEFDLFGLEASYYPMAPIDMPNDGIRVDYLSRLCAAGYEAQIVIAQDVDAKTRLRKYGGWGFEHILVNVVPLMRRKGMSQSHITAILTSNPARLLAIDDLAGSSLTKT